MLKVHAKNLGTVAILCLQGRIVNGETATLRDAVRSQSQVSAVVLDLAPTCCDLQADVGVAPAD